MYVSVIYILGILYVFRQQLCRLRENHHLSATQHNNADAPDAAFSRLHIRGACFKKYDNHKKDGRENRFYIFGGKDEGSAALIQGMTLSGVMLDETALMPRSFCEQAIARCSVDNSRLWFNCNPENPAHWFYTEWIKKAVDKNCLYLHFTMDDNPSLSEEIKQRYKNLYSGSFYERFIEGKWVSCDGAVYPFSTAHIYTTCR